MRKLMLIGGGVLVFSLMLQYLSLRYDWAGDYNANIVVVSDTRLRDVRVHFFGREAASVPPKAEGFNFLFPNLRPAGRPQAISVEWILEDGTKKTIERTIEYNYTGKKCLYVLKIDDNGDPKFHSVRNDFEPFYFSCVYY